MADVYSPAGPAAGTELIHLAVPAAAALAVRHVGGERHPSGVSVVLHVQGVATASSLAAEPAGLPWVQGVSARDANEMIE